MANNAAYDAFRNLAGEDGEIDAYELQGILNKIFTRDFKFDGFSTDMTRGMVASLDLDLSGKLGFEDFKNLWTDLVTCKRVFMVMDTDGSGAFSRSEFQRALEMISLSVSDRTLKALMMRYSDKDGTVKFDDFVACYIKLKSMIDTFSEKEKSGEGSAEFTLGEYVQLGVYS